LAEKSQQITDLQTKTNNPVNQIADNTIPSSKLKTLNDYDRIGLGNLKQEVIQAMAGTTPVNSIPAKGSVTPDITSFFKVGKNLFNKDAVTSGYYVNTSNGNLAVNANYVTSEYISIEPNTDYSMTALYYAAYYDVNKAFISAVTGTKSPSNAKFMRVSFNITEVASNTFQIEKGTSLTSYEAFSQYIPKELVEDKIINTNQASFITLGKNLFNKSTATDGYYVNENNGILGANANYYASDYIPVEPNTSYTQNEVLHMAFYDQNKTYLSGIAYGDGNGKTFTTPANAKYIRISINKSWSLDYIQVEKGTVFTGYQPYGLYLSKDLYKSDWVDVFLPSEICVAVGRTIELYNQQVAWCGNVNNFHFKWDCTVGKAMKRKFTLTGTSGLIGEYPLNLSVYDNNMLLVATASTTLKVVSSTISTSKNILTIGDSLTNGKPWLDELRSLSANKFTMVGTRGVSPLKHEGRSGFSAANYLAGTAYTYEGEGIHPFWDGTRFNWSYYKTQTGINPNVVQIYLGTNGIGLDPTTNAKNIKQIVDYIRQDDASIPIFLVYTLYRGNQDGIGNEVATDGYALSKGSWKVEEDRKVFNLMVKLNSLLSGYSNLHFVPISLCHDSEYNFGADITPVNPRATQTEQLPSQATHPQTQGYYQMADIMFSVMAKYLSA
jgi:lysophospholipase L1-like esterase